MRWRDDFRDPSGTSPATGPSFAMPAFALEVRIPGFTIPFPSPVPA
jgi:hypothetical protein